MLTSLKPDLLPFEELARSFAAKELPRKWRSMTAILSENFHTRVLDKAYEVGFLGVVLPKKTRRHRGGRYALRDPSEYLPDRRLAGRYHLHQCPSPGDHALCRGREARGHYLSQGILGR